MNFSAIIFDLDGTLADTLEDIADNMNRVLAENGFPPHAYDAYRYFVGGGLHNLVVQCLPQHAQTDDIIARCYASMISEYNKNCINKTRLYDGIPELLDTLSSQGVRMAVISNKADMLTQKICAVLLKNWKFEAVIGASEHFPRKPNPASALFVAQQMKIPPEKICYLGDSDVDMKTATAAGFYPVGVAWGFRPVKELLENGAKKIIQHPTDIIPLY